MYTTSMLCDQPNQLVFDTRDKSELWTLASMIGVFQVEEVDFEIIRMNDANRTQVTLSIKSTEKE